MRKWLFCSVIPCFLFVQEHEFQVQSDLQKIGSPPKAWMVVAREPDTLDVAIIGGGMSGSAAAFALVAEGITNIKIFDDNPRGYEGPWLRFARMPTLRSIKTYMGPALGIPALTFQAWYESKHDSEAWKQLDKIPTTSWSQYLLWFRTVLNLPCENNVKLCTISPKADVFELTFETSDAYFTTKARKIVLATGRDGSGGYVVPHYAEDIPCHLFTHTNETIYPDELNGRSITVIGCGASAFDISSYALENGAIQVDMLVRRTEIPQVNKFAEFFHPGFVQGFYRLSDEMRSLFVSEALEWGIPPPKTALKRLEGHVNFHIHYCTDVQELTAFADHLNVKTNRGSFKTDYLILATGFDVDLSQREELREFWHHIALWDAHVPEYLLKKQPKLGRFPYLGDHFQFQEKIPEAAPYLKNIYCFNYGALLSLGLLAADIPAVSTGARRLAQGIAADFFIEDQQAFYDSFRSYEQLLFECRDFDILQEDYSCPFCE